MPTSKDNLVVKNKIITNEGSVTCTKSCREALVMSVAKTEDCASVALLAILTANLKQSKIALPEASEVVILSYNVVAIVIEMRADSVDKVTMANWSPCVSCLWSLHCTDFIEADFSMFSTTDV
jgi:hypothetical protein